jgi:DNA-binding response OmpR family regulator
LSGECILIVDDELNIVQLARLYLEREGFQVEAAGDGQTALDLIPRLRPAMLVLDLMLPKVDGWEVCRHLRQQGNQIPILMLSARDEDIDKILGLELGADDYLTKPFNPRELVARIKAILRRSERIFPKADAILHAGDLVLDSASREVTIQGAQVDLRAQEFDLLAVLLQHRGRVLSREKLLELAWGFDFYGQTRTVDVHIGQLRRKIAASSVEIETVSGVGYKLVA